MESILTTIKTMLGIPEDETHFDQDIKININSVFMTLNQLGVGPSNGFFISDSTKTWSDFLQDQTDVEAVKSYMYLKVKLIFDPPSTSFVLDSMERQIKEWEWRLNAQVEKIIPEGGV